MFRIPAGTPADVRLWAFGANLAEPAVQTVPKKCSPAVACSTLANIRLDELTDADGSTAGLEQKLAIGWGHAIYVQQSTGRIFGRCPQLNCLHSAVYFALLLQTMAETGTVGGSGARTRTARCRLELWSAVNT